MGIKLPNTIQAYHCFTQLESVGAKRKLDFTPSRCTIPRLVTLDSVAYPGFGKKLAPGTAHQRDGSMVTLWYKAMHKPKPEQIAAADRAVRLQGIPRNRYTGRLVDVFRHKGSLYVLLMDVQERDFIKGKKVGLTNYRHFNLDDGNLYKGFIEAVPVAKPSAVKAAVASLAKVKAKKVAPKQVKKVKP